MYRTRSRISSSNFNMIGIITEVNESDHDMSIQCSLRLITSPAIISILIIRMRSQRISSCTVSRMRGRTSSYNCNAMFSRNELSIILVNHAYLTALLNAGDERTVVTSCFSGTSEQKKLRNSSLSRSHTSMVNRIALRIRLSNVSLLLR